MVGPDLFLLLQGQLFHDGNSSNGNAGGKNVSLILCGESHNDAVDVTRRSPPGKFEPTEGWIRVFDSLQSDGENDICTALPSALFVSSQRDGSQRAQTSASSRHRPSLPSIENLALRFLFPVNGKKNKPVTIERAKELAASLIEKYDIEEDMFGRNLLLLWVSTTENSGRTEKGEAFLLEIEAEARIEDLIENDEETNDGDSSDSDDEYESFDDWVFFTNDPVLYNNPIQQQNRLELPELVERWMDDLMMVVHDDDSTAATIDDAIDDIMEEPGNNQANGEATNIVEGVSEHGGGAVPSIRRRLMNRRLDRYVLFEFGDLDSVAYNVLKRRLGMTDIELDTSEYDQVIESRKLDLKEKDNVWTFDDWFDHVKMGAEKKEQSSGMNAGDAEGKSDPAVHLVLEASVPPWEVELHRPNLKALDHDGGTTIDAEDFRLHPAADCVRCLSEDSELSWEDECDPSNDGIGSYVDYIYRKMMTATMKIETSIETKESARELKERAVQKFDRKDDDKDNATENRISNGNKTVDERQSWLHCIDVRDLGCEAACHAESVKQDWYDLLSQDEQELISNPKDVEKDACPVNQHGDAMRFLPANKLNPEWIELERLKSEGCLVREEDGDTEDAGEYERDEELLEFSFPSFENFFGSNTDILYYNPNVKLAYSPFLFHCVKSLDNWKSFFTALFFGGTIPEALGMLNLRDEISRKSVHVRSPILKHWDAQSNAYVWKERDEEECYITCPFFPFAFHLVAKGSSPPRTWSSQLFAKLHDADESRRRVALVMKEWIIDSIHRNMEDPKASDDKECGGEWFAAYLRAAHREISDDIDNSDSAVLLQKNYMKSISGGKMKKHNIGKIRIPSAREAFEEICTRFCEAGKLPPTENVVSPRVEVLAKILIDIWVSNLFDFSLLLKIASICANENSDNVVVVCYVGSAHARAASDFFCEKLGFQRKVLVGKFTWEDDEIQTLDLPSKLWNLNELFK